MTTHSSLIEELERALAGGSNTHRIEMLSRITDLFMAGANRYSGEQVDLFDEVIAKLATAIEAKARAKLSIRLAGVPTAPAGVVRMLAFDDDIEVARPVLKESDRLNDQDLRPMPTARVSITSPPSRSAARSARPSPTYWCRAGTGTSSTRSPRMPGPGFPTPASACW
jgi:hypothetical protein